MLLLDHLFIIAIKDGKKIDRKLIYANIFMIYCTYMNNVHAYMNIFFSSKFISSMCRSVCPNLWQPFNAFDRNISSESGGGGEELVDVVIIKRGGRLCGVV